MSIHVAIRHTTVYKFDRRVTLSPHVVRLRPAPHSRTPILAYTLKITPEQHFINWQQDPFGNYLARLVFPEATREFSVDVEVIADLTVINPFDYFVEESAEYFPFDYDAALKRELTPYLETDPAGPLLQAWLAKVPRERVHCNDFLVALNQRLQGDIAYTVRMEPGVQTPRRDAAEGARLLPRLGLAAGADPAPSGPGRALRVGLSGAAHRRREIARRPVGHRKGLYRPARLGRGVSARRRLDRARSDLGAVRRRRPHSAGRDAAAVFRRTDRGHDRYVRGRVRVFQHRHPHP